MESNRRKSEMCQFYLKNSGSPSKRLHINYTRKERLLAGDFSDLDKDIAAAAADTMPSMIPDQVLCVSPGINDSEVEKADAVGIGTTDASLGNRDVANQESVIMVDSNEDEESQDDIFSEDLECLLWLEDEMRETFLKIKQNHVKTESRSIDAEVPDAEMSVEPSDAKMYKKMDSQEQGKDATNKEKKIESRQCRKEDTEYQKEETENKTRDAEVPNAKMFVEVSDAKIDKCQKEDNSFVMQSCQGDTEGVTQSDGLEDLWRDMELAFESSKSLTSNGHTSVDPVVGQKAEECDHDYMLRDDFGLVCLICGIIGKSIETIFEYQWSKDSHSTRTYPSSSGKYRDLTGKADSFEARVLEDDPVAAELCIHPRHMKKMKPHQLEGFNFLAKNFVNDKPGGCIIAHAPGSGKTFMLISFIQSFLAKYPSTRPMVVLPMGILPTWKSEILQWQVEDTPVYDFYSRKADNRSQQLEVLKLWQEKRSVLILGYKQFSTIICGDQHSKVSDECREILLKVPGLLILDEGHIPRNKETDLLKALARVQTPCKVVLSGTLFQNHVREVFNILDLVRPNFLKMESSQAIVNRILSKMHISGGKRQHMGSWESQFPDLIQENLRNKDSTKMNFAIIQELRELTKDVLHYYKGDVLQELPGLVDFTVLLTLSPSQTAMVPKLMEFDLFKKISGGNCLYIHPCLFDTPGRDSREFTEEEIDAILDCINIGDGVKTRFFLKICDLADSVGEKVLVFSQYILPLKFLGRLLMKTKGWQMEKEIFMISGDSSSELRERYTQQFNTSPHAKILFGSIKACGEGISLVGASRVVILDIHLNPSVTRQAIGRAFRPGQTKKVYTYRLVAAESPEEELHRASLRKEFISKLWFEWNGYYGQPEFQLEEVEIGNCQDQFLESPILCKDIKALYIR